MPLLTNLTNDALPTNFPVHLCLECTMGKPLNIYEAKTHLSELVERAQAGEEIVIAKAGRPMARLVPLRHAGPARAPGRWAKSVTIAADFDAPLPEEILRAFEGRDG
jgi:prevent-host-death family protein